MSMELNEKVSDLDKRVAVLEVRVEMQQSSIEKLEKKIDGLISKIDRLIDIQSWGKWKHSLMWSSLGGGILGLVHLILSHLGNK